MDWDDTGHLPNEDYDEGAFEKSITMTPRERELVDEWVKRPRYMGWADTIDRMAADVVEDTMSTMDMGNLPDPCRQTYIDCIAAGAYVVVEDADERNSSPAELVRSLRNYAQNAVRGRVQGTCEECGQ